MLQSCLGASWIDLDRGGIPGHAANWAGYGFSAEGPSRDEGADLDNLGGARLTLLKDNPGERQYLIGSKKSTSPRHP